MSRRFRFHNLVTPYPALARPLRNTASQKSALASNARPVLQRSAVERIKGSEVVANHSRQTEEPVFVLEVQQRIAHVRVVDNQCWVRCSRGGIVDVFG